MIIGRLGDGGKERQLLLLLKTLKQHRDIFTCLVVMNSGGEREKEAAQVTDKLVVLRDRNKVDLIRPMIKLVHLVKTNKIGLIHTWGSGIWDFLGLFAGRWCHIPVLHNGIRSAPNQLNIYNHLTRLSARFSDAAVANSQAGLNAFNLTKHPKSTVIYNGLDLSRFEGTKLVDEGRNLCMVANFRQEKDHRSLILAMPDILEHFPDAKLNLVGHDYGTLDEIQDLVNDLQITEKVVFITDCTHPEPVISCSQIGILTTNQAAHGEGISNALIEYMASSKPVIASNDGGSPEVVDDNVTGFLVQPGSHIAISKKVLYLLENPVIAQRMGAKGKSIVNKRFSLEKMEKDYINLYREMSI
ncbi:MAG: glycosyltransferase [Chloroflexota bacterium]|nr:glycosyltransferase [Chloroflexota bacterium]